MKAKESLQMGSLCLFLSLIFPTHILGAISGCMDTFGIYYTYLWMWGLEIDIYNGTLTARFIFEIPYVLAPIWKIVSTLTTIFVSFSMVFFLLNSFAKNPLRFIKRLMLSVWISQLFIFLLYMVYYTLLFYPNFGSLFLILGLFFTIKGIIST